MRLPFGFYIHRLSKQNAMQAIDAEIIVTALDESNALRTSVIAGTQSYIVRTETNALKVCVVVQLEKILLNMCGNTFAQGISSAAQTITANSKQEKAQHGRR